MKKLTNEEEFILFIFVGLFAPMLIIATLLYREQIEEFTKTPLFIYSFSGLVFAWGCYRVIKHLIVK